MPRRKSTGTAINMLFPNPAWAELFRDSQIYFGVPKQGKLYFIQHMTPEAELPSLSVMVEAIYGCKWSLTVYKLLQEGINRPGEMVRSVDGLSTKVLNQCLRRNLSFSIIKRTAYPEIPPRVEYRVTPFGKKFIRILDEIQKLQKDIEHLPRRDSVSARKS